MYVLYCSGIMYPLFYMLDCTKQDTYVINKMMVQPNHLVRLLYKCAWFLKHTKLALECLQQWRNHVGGEKKQTRTWCLFGMAAKCKTIPHYELLLYELLLVWGHAKLAVGVQLAGGEHRGRH